MEIIFMKKNKRNYPNNLILWIGLILIVAFSSICLCSILENIIYQVISTSQNLNIKETISKIEAINLWKTVYIPLILTATGFLIFSGITTLLHPQLDKLHKKL